MKSVVDINCDLGEGGRSDDLLMPLISSANIACGYHAGDEETMRRSIKTAMKNGISIGAHPGYRDRENFGRLNQSLSTDEITDLVTEQIQILKKLVNEQGGILKHVKPHGALYNQAATDMEMSRAIAKAIYKLDGKLLLLGLANSCLLEAAEEIGLKTGSEVFADRAYTDQGTLVPRNQSGAIIHDPQKCKDRVLQMITEGLVESISGKQIAIQADSVCIHGDHPDALELARELQAHLLANGVIIQSMV